MEAQQRVREDILPLFRELHASDKLPFVHPCGNTASPPAGEHNHNMEGTVDSSHATDASRYQSLQRQETIDLEKALAQQVPSEEPLKKAQNPPETTLYDYIPLLLFFKWVILVILRRTASFTQTVGERRKRSARDALGRKRRIKRTESNVPIEICLYLSRQALSSLRVNPD